MFIQNQVLANRSITKLNFVIDIKTRSIPSCLEKNSKEKLTERIIRLFEKKATSLKSRKIWKCLMLGGTRSATQDNYYSKEFISKHFKFM